MQFIDDTLFIAESLSQAKEENLGMHQVLDQTLQELNSLWKRKKKKNTRTKHSLKKINTPIFL